MQQTKQDGECLNTHTHRRDLMHFLSTSFKNLKALFISSVWHWQATLDLGIKTWKIAIIFYIFFCIFRVCLWESVCVCVRVMSSAVVDSAKCLIRRTLSSDSIINEAHTHTHTHTQADVMYKPCGIRCQIAPCFPACQSNPRNSNTIFYSTIWWGALMPLCMLAHTPHYKCAH